MGGKCIEFHLDIEEKVKNLKQDIAASHEIKKVIDATKNLQIIDGSGIKKPSESEKIDRDWRADPEDGLRPLKFMR